MAAIRDSWAHTFALVSTVGFLTTPVIAQPALLGITKAASGEVEIRWTNRPPGLVLESSVDLVAPALWQPAAEVPLVNGDLRTVTVAPASITRFYRLREASLTTLVETSPASGEAGISLTRETVFRFSNPLAAGTQLATDRVFAEFGGRKLLARVALANDRRQATLFYLEPLPAASRVRVSFNSDGLLDANGQAVDGDGDGRPGGTRQVTFITMSTAGIPGTGVFGRVFASDPVPAGNGVTNRPLAGVIVTVDGAEERLRTETDESGFFLLSPSPAGQFFVHIDGRPALGSQWPDGEYYPFVGKTFEAVAGRTNNPAGGTGEIFLPLVKAGTLRAVSPTQPTTIEFPPTVLAEHPELAGVNLVVPPNALYADDGTRGGRVGLAPVAPDRIPSPLPPGLNFPMVITIQTDGPSNFDQPAPVRFPNLPDPVTGQVLPPGAKSALWSYNHDTGRWEIQGSMTVSADGKFVDTDPGVGVLQPGWHSSTPGSTGGGGGGGGPGPCQAEADAVQDAFMGCMQGAFLELLELSPGLGCAVSLGQAAVSSIQDCSDPSQSCAGALAYNGLFGVAGCIPGVGTVAGLAQCAYEMKTATDAMAACQARNGSLAAIMALSTRRNTIGLANDDDLALQDQILGTLRSLIVAIYGDPVWLEAAAADNANTLAFGNTLVAALDPVSEDAAGISAAERTALLTLPAPNGLPVVTVAALLDRFDRFAHGGMSAAEKTAIQDAANALSAAATAAQGAGWETMLDGLFGQMAEITRKNDEGFRRASGGTAATQASPQPAVGNASGYGPLRQTELLYHLADLSTGFVRRGRTSPNGQLDNVIMGVETPYLLTYLDPATLELGTVHFHSGAAGDRFSLPLALLSQVNGTDSDQDGLSDAIEDIAGTRRDEVDTDHDGDSDFLEVRQGQNALDGLALPQAVVANLPLGGSTTGLSSDARALGLHVDGSRVFIANGKRGLAVVDATDPLRPVWQGEVDLLGESFDISYSPDQEVAALVASPEQFIPGERGLLHFVDVSDPGAPRLKQSYSLPAVAVDQWDGMFFVALGQFALKEVRVYDAGSALAVASLTTQDFPTGLRVVGGRAYVATLSGLEIFDARRGALNRLGRLAGDFSAELLGRVHLILDGPTLYVGKTRGVATIDVSNPAAPKFIGVPPATTGAVRSLALNGGPRMVAIVSGLPDGNPQAAAALSVYDASSPANTATLLFGIGTPGRARDVALLQGFAAVADDSRGLTVVNFADPDLNRQAPSIIFDPAVLDVDPAATGIQIKEGSTLELLPRVVDDVQLGRTDLLVNSVVTDSKRDFPVILGWIITNLVAQPGIETNLVLQFRALDRSGNERRSDPVTIQLVRDLDPPVVVFSLPAAGQVAFAEHSFLLEFNEPVDTRPLDTSRLRLLGLGADAVLGGGDDTEQPPAFASARESVVRLHFPGAPAGRYQLTIEAGAVQDRAGNALAQSSVIAFDLVAVHPGSAVWISDADGQWDNPANWLHGRLPSQDDDVVILRFGAKPKVTLDSSAIVKSLLIGTPFTTANRAGLTVLRDLHATEMVDIPDDNVLVNGSALFEKPLTINGGLLQVSKRLETKGLLTLSRGGGLVLAGPDAQFLPMGGLQGANFTFMARDGAQIELPGLATYDGPGDFTPLFPVGTSFRAQGVGTQLTLPDLTSATGPVDWNARGVPSLAFEAVSGGELQLPALTALSNRVKLSASGDGSLLNAPVLTRVTGTEAPFEAGIEAAFNGRVQIPSLTVIEHCPITERDGGIVVRPGQ